jgi:hypothetical protein
VSEASAIIEHPAPHPLAAWREIDGVVVVITPGDSVLHELNASASFIWKNLNGERTPEEIAGLLAEEFEVSGEQARADVREFLAGLVAKGLLAPRGEAAHG